MKDILVSVLMSTYNEPLEFISEAISSIESQTYKNLEIIVVNDNPMRNDLKDFLRSLEKDGKIILVENSTNMGLTQSLNRGLKCCTGTLVARMDADDIACKDRIENEVKYLFYNNLDIVGTYIQPIDMQGNNFGNPQKYPVWNWGCKNYLKARSALIHPTWLVKKKVYCTLNGYRDFSCAEDYDFLLRASNQFHMACCPVIGLKYRINNAGISQSNKVKQKVVSRFLRKNMYSINKIDPNEFDISMELHSKNTKEIICYFAELDEIRRMKKDNNVLFVFRYLNLLCDSQYARSALLEVLRIKVVLIISTLIEKRGNSRWKYI